LGVCDAKGPTDVFICDVFDPGSPAHVLADEPPRWGIVELELERLGLSALFYDGEGDNRAVPGSRRRRTDNRSRASGHLGVMLPVQTPKALERLEKMPPRVHGEIQVMRGARTSRADRFRTMVQV
jgi:hypothetical protein